MIVVGDKKIYVNWESGHIPQIHVNAYLLLSKPSAAARGGSRGQETLNDIKEVLYYAISRPNTNKQFDLIVDMEHTKLGTVDKSLLSFLVSELKNDRMLDDTLQSCSVYNSSCGIHTLYDLISSLLDPSTKKKVRFIHD